MQSGKKKKWRRKTRTRNDLVFRQPEWIWEEKSILLQPLSNVCDRINVHKLSRSELVSDGLANWSGWKEIDEKKQIPSTHVSRWVDFPTHGPAPLSDLLALSRNTGHPDLLGNLPSAPPPPPRATLVTSSNSTWRPVASHYSESDNEEKSVLLIHHQGRGSPVLRYDTSFYKCYCWRILCRALCQKHMYVSAHWILATL